MIRDAQGHALTAATPEATALYDTAVQASAVTAPTTSVLQGVPQGSGKVANSL